MTPETPEDITERLRMESRLSRNGGVLFLPALLDKAADEIERLSALVAQYKGDAERYRWLREMVKPQSDHWWHVMDRSIRISGDFDAAIDKARGK